MLLALTNGGAAQIDPEDAHLCEYRWRRCREKGGRVYARRSGWRAGEPYKGALHQAVMGTGSRDTVDHMNGDGLDNRRSNLRVTDTRTNARNVAGANEQSQTGIRGVTWHKKSGKWQAVIKADGRLKYLGIYVDIEDARRARAKAEIELWGIQPRRAAELAAYG